MAKSGDKDIDRILEAHPDLRPTYEWLHSKLQNDEALQYESLQSTIIVYALVARLVDAECNWEGYSNSKNMDVVLLQSYKTKTETVYNRLGLQTRLSFKHFWGHNEFNTKSMHICKNCLRVARTGKYTGEKACCPLSHSVQRKKLKVLIEPGYSGYLRLLHRHFRCNDPSTQCALSTLCAQGGEFWAELDIYKKSLCG